MEVSVPLPRSDHDLGHADRLPLSAWAFGLLAPHSGDINRTLARLSELTGVAATARQPGPCQAAAVADCQIRWAPGRPSSTTNEAKSYTGASRRLTFRTIRRSVRHSCGVTVQRT